MCEVGSRRLLLKMQMTDSALLPLNRFHFCSMVMCLVWFFFFFSREDGSSSHHITQASLELTILPLPSKSDSYKLILPHSLTSNVALEHTLR